MDDDSDVEQQLTIDYDSADVETSIALNKEVREWNEKSGQAKKCIPPALRTAFSVIAHVGFLVCMGLIVWSTQFRVTIEDSGEYVANYTVCYIVSSLLAAALYLCILVEAAASDTCAYIKNYISTLTPECYVERTRDACPMIRWKALCYHYESTMGQSSKGSSHVNQLRHKDKVVTWEETDAFKFNKWRDLTRDIKGLLQLPVIRLDCSKIFIFRDENTKEVYMKQYVGFRERNRRRDEFMEHEEMFSIPGFRERLLLGADVHRRPCWLRGSVFWIFTILLLTWPYRIFFRKKSTKVYIVFIKELEV